MRRRLPVRNRDARRLACLMVLAVALLGCALPQIAGATEWTIKSPASVSLLEENVSKGVACSTSTACVAVGWHLNSSGVYDGTAQTWNGTSWTIHNPAVPSGATLSALAGVACSSSTACTGVGYYTNSSGTTVTLAERWNGTAWSIQTTPNPSGAKSSELRGVSCASSTSCIAVGEYVNSSGTTVTLGESWNGTEWVIKTTPNPTGAKASALASVSCTSSSACTAVGSFEYSTKAWEPVAERWNGTEWSLQTAKIPAASSNTFFSSVSCTSSTACTAVGYFSYSIPAANSKTLAERWNGTEWTIQTTANSGAYETILRSVSCASATACTAVGEETNGSSVIATWAEAWNGTEWKAQTAKNPTGTGKTLRAVSCTESAACTAVGWYVNSEGVTTNQVQRWNGTEWSLQTGATQNYVPASKLNGVSCTSSTACTAVGWYKTSLGVTIPLAERWNGTEWALQAVPGEEVAFNSVSCVSSTLCTAAGVSGYTATAYRWNGTEWKNLFVISTEGELLSISCFPSYYCFTVGENELINKATNVLGLLEENANWQRQEIGWESTSSINSMRSISCPTNSTSACVVVGALDTTPLLAGYNSETSEWRNKSAKVEIPSGAEKSLFESVSCLPEPFHPNKCEAAGDYYSTTEKAYLPLAERSDEAWTIQSTPHPSGAKNSYLKSVSCASTTACTAVGDYVNSSGTTVTLAEAWNGTEWKVQSTPNPSGAKESVLKSMSCTSSTACVAVGWYVNSEGLTTPLTEVY